jgi:hypothetical protein
VERVVGAPIREISPTLIEYKSGKPGERVFVQYRKGSLVVERIEGAWAPPWARADALGTLRLPQKATASQTSPLGRKVEYFSPAMLVLTYTADGAGIGGIAFYSAELFQATSGIASAAPAVVRPATAITSARSGSTALTPPPLPPAVVPPGITVPTSSASVAARGGGSTGTKVDPIGVAKYIGCFRDTNRPFDLDGSLTQGASNTPEQCIQTCRQKGFPYAGVQNGQSCLCGNTYGRYAQASNCNVKCTGNSAEICGGSYANGVYSTGVAH